MTSPPDIKNVEKLLRDALQEMAACCLDDPTDFDRVLASVVLTTLELIDLDRRSRT